MPVYFIQADNGPIKIGYSRDIKTRLATMQNDHYAELCLVGVLPGTFSTERETQDRFARSRLRGEWYHPTPDLLDFIKTLSREYDGKTSEEPPIDWQLCQGTRKDGENCKNIASPGSHFCRWHQGGKNAT